MLDGVPEAGYGDALGGGGEVSTTYSAIPPSAPPSAAPPTSASLASAMTETQQAAVIYQLLQNAGLAEIA